MKRHLHAPLTKRSAAVALATLVALALLGWGGWHLWMKFSGRPLSVAQTKRAIWKRLGEQSRARKIQAPPGAADATFVDVPSATSTTNKSGRVRAVSRVTRSSQELPETTLSDYFRTNQTLAASYDTMYRLIGEELKAAEALLDGTNVLRQLTALTLAGEASIYARTNALDFWLSARICEAYLWPRLALVEGTNSAGVTHEAVLSLCELAFRDAWETNNMIRAYEAIMARSTRTASVDMARFRLALIYIDQGRNAEALKLLKSLKALKSTKIDREIATLERLLAEKPK